jgi:hypothetical protein
MTLWKLVKNHQRIYGKLSWKNLRSTENISPLLFAFVRDGSIFFALYVPEACLGQILIISFFQRVESVFPQTIPSKIALAEN